MRHPGDLLARGRLDDPRRFVPRPDGNSLPARAPRYRPHSVIVRHPSDLLARGCLDDPRALILRSGRQPSAVRAPRYRIHPAAMRHNGPLAVAQIGAVELYLRLGNQRAACMPRVVALHVWHARQCHQHGERRVAAARLIRDRLRRLRQQPRLRNQRLAGDGLSGLLAFLSFLRSRDGGIFLRHDLHVAHHKRCGLLACIPPKPTGNTGQHEGYCQPRNGIACGTAGRVGSAFSELALFLRFALARAHLRRFMRLARLNEIHLLGQHRRRRGFTRFDEPLCIFDVLARHQAVRRPPALVPIARAGGEPAVGVDPRQVGLQRLDQLAQADHERAAAVKAGIVDQREALWRARRARRPWRAVTLGALRRLVEPAMHHGDDALAAAVRFVDFPLANVRACAVWREHEHHGCVLRD